MEIAIIGGGVAGLILALTLHKHSIKCTIYELRETSDVANPGAIALGPNALRHIERLGLLDDVRAVSWPIWLMQFRDQEDNLFSTVDMGGKKRCGYDTLRIVRHNFHDILLSAVGSAGITIISGKKFSHVISSTSGAVTFGFTDNTQSTASILIGADGIHSPVRKTVTAHSELEYTGSLTLAAKLPTNPLLELPQSDELHTRLHSLTITRGIHGSFLACTQSPGGQEVGIGVQIPYPEQNRGKWEDLLKNYQKQYELLMADYDTWPEMVQILLRSVTVQDMYRSWPFYALPDLEQWSTPERNVILVGDAAHAIPPSGGQGACMAVEDAWSLGVALGSCQSDNIEVNSEDFRTRITDWQTERRRRVDLVRTMTNRMGNARLPQELREKLPPGEYFTGDDDAARDLEWLYGYDCDDHVAPN